MTIRSAIITVSVIIGAITCSVVALRAAEFTKDGFLTAGPRGCVTGEVLVVIDGLRLCVDKYEAAVEKSCPELSPRTIEETARNVAARDCVPVSEEGKEPWSFVSYTQAKQLCAKAGKRLLSNTEWSTLALGLSSEEECNLDSKALRATKDTSCSTPSGLVDMVGNAWEYVTPLVENGAVDGVDLPPSGYVSLVNEDGLTLETKDQPQVVYGEDYMWSELSGVRALMRGGFYRSQGDGGVYTLQATLPPDVGTAATGFRCAYELSV